jgi:SAM-dependent methyltransferase
MSMTEAVQERIRRYILDGSDHDLRRLLGISQSSADMARAAFRRVEVQPGWRVIECGCGPLGALAVMAEMVGPGGRVLGVDFSEPTVDKARSVVSALGLNNVAVVTGDVNELELGAVGGPFDLAYTRLFLMHQADPVQTLRQIAKLLRPGGWLIAQEPLRTPPPRSQPDVEALSRYWELLHQVIERLGVPHDAVEHLPRYAREAGFEVHGTSGYFMALDPDLGFELHASTVEAARERAIRSGVATEQELDELARSLRAARHGTCEWVVAPFFFDLTLRKPASVEHTNGRSAHP